MSGARASVSLFTPVCDGPHAVIRLEVKVFKSFGDMTVGRDRDSRKRQIHLSRAFREFCDHPDFANRLPLEKLRREDGYKDGRGGQVAVWAFKARHIRIYGIILPFHGKRCFAGVEIDIAKKQDAADQALMRRAALKGGALIEYR